MGVGLRTRPPARHDLWAIDRRRLSQLLDADGIRTGLFHKANHAERAPDLVALDDADSHPLLIRAKLSGGIGDRVWKKLLGYQISTDRVMGGWIAAKAWLYRELRERP